MYYPHVDHLLPYMPEAVKAAQDAHGGDPGVVGFCPELEAWVRTSTEPFVEYWRNCLVRWSAHELDLARRQQVTMAEYAREAYAGCETSGVRVRTTIHPKIKSWMETMHGTEVFNDEKAIADTERLQPKLFFNK